MLKDKMTLLGILLLLISTFANISSYKIVQDDTNDFLLPDIITPFNYKLDIVFSKDNLESKSDTFEGSVEISFYVKNETKTIKLHAPSNNTKIEKIETIAVNDQEFNETTSVLTINLADKLVPLTKYVLKANYTADINTNYMRGAYRSSYKNKAGDVEYLIATQFKPTSAREVFPCFDEPKYKATYNISITHPNGTQALSNAKMNTTMNSANDNVVTTFQQTEKMSTYLVGFVVTTFTYDTVNEAGVTYKVWSRNDFKGHRKFALEWSKKMLLALESFTGISYGASDTKLDQITLPDAQSAGMENWGLITYKENSLLFNGKESSDFTQQSILETMARELSHQWFGDLVTCHWWDDAFLNEGFATYFQHYLLDDILDELASWEMDNQFLVNKLQPVLVDDALKDEALTRKVIEPEDIQSKFDSISNNKGASIIRMIANVMGEHAFRAGLKDYLKKKSYSNASPSDLFNSLEPVSNLTQKIGVLMEGWFNNPGYPVITATQQGADLVLSQKQFRYNKDDKANQAKWYVPISYTLQSDKDKFLSPAPRAWLGPKEDLVIKDVFSGNSENDWVIINSLVSGYYRVNYNETLRKRIENQLRENHTAIHRLNKAQIIDDLFNLARSDDGLQYSEVFSYLDYMKNETCYYSWAAVLASLNFLTTRASDQKPLESALHHKILELMSGVYSSISFNSSKSDTQIDLLKRKLILSNACKFGAKNCTTQVKSLYDAFKTTNHPIDRNLRSVVYCYGLMQSEDDSDWDFMWNLYKGTELPSEQIEVLEALGCTLNDKQLNNYLDLSLKASEIRKQDLPTVWKAVYSNSQEGAKVSLNYLIANHTAIKDYYPNAENLLSGIASHIVDKDGIQKLKDFVATADLDESFKVAGNLAIKTATDNVNWIQKNRADLESYLEVTTSGTTITTTFSCLMLITVALFNYVTI